MHTTALHLGFVGGGNMAQAIAGGLLKQGFSAAQLLVVEPLQASREVWHDWGVRSIAQADATLASCNMLVWAVKPQSFAQAAQQVAPWAQQALHLSVMAGIAIASIEQTMNTPAVVRCMPNTPALIGQGMTGIYAPASTTPAQKAWVQQVLQATGQLLWVDAEEDLHAVTALSGSGPAYVFYFLEALVQAGVDLGLPAPTARQLAVQTFAGAAALAAQSTESLAILRERVTSKGGTTYAAISHMQANDLAQHITNAAAAAHARSVELGKS